jgi:pyridoxamine 5'-phosphate oxidase
MADDASLRDRLRSIPTVAPTYPRFNTEAAPGEPMPLFLEWLDAAIEDGVPQPLSMSVATATRDGHPSNRTLILKDADATSLWFAALSSGQKGRDLAENPEVALVFYWGPQGRQIRVVGRVEEGPRDVSRRDFLARTLNARARAIAGHQGERLVDSEPEVAQARQLLQANPDFVPEDWVAYRVIPTCVEFWQAERERDQVRLRYLLVRERWVKDLLWP